MIIEPTHTLAHYQEQWRQEKADLTKTINHIELAVANAHQRWEDDEDADRQWMLETLLADLDGILSITKEKS